jgi:hypothetical protein
MISMQKIREDTALHEDEIIKKFERNNSQLLGYIDYLLKDASQKGQNLVYVPIGKHRPYERYLILYLERKGYTVNTVSRNIIIHW